MKERIRLFYEKLFFTPKPFPPGNYQTTLTDDDGSPIRLHLRVEKDGLGLLIVNASTILHLNPTATEIAYHLIQNTADEDALKEMMKRYRVEESVIRDDFTNFKERLHAIIHTPDLDPETFLDVDRLELHETQVSAPLRLDCALTYQLSSGESSIYAPTDRIKRNLDTEEWKTILSHAWQVGIPHIVFTGGEPTLRPDLIELIQTTQDIGQVSGLITDGLRLTEKDYLQNLLQAGLDHVMFILDPDEPQSLEALRDLLSEDIFVTVHLTLTQNNFARLTTLLDELQQLQVKSISITAESPDFKSQLALAQQKCAEMSFSMVWDLPVPYSMQNPIRAELENSVGIKEGAGRTWLYVEPDGDVLPGQGINQVLGNFLTDPWEQIWANAAK